MSVYRIYWTNFWRNYCDGPRRQPYKIKL